MFGDSVRLRDEYGIRWSGTGHFLRVPGYVYAYAFGELLVFALYSIYQEEGEAFVPKYFDMLAAGGSDYPDRIMSKMGVDLNDLAFWHKGLDEISDMIDWEEKLAREVYPDKF
jgi:oligoendopeptidase F